MGKAVRSWGTLRHPARSLQFGGGGDANDAERARFLLCLIIKLPGAVIIFMALGIDDEMGFAAKTVAAAGSRENFSAIDRAELCVAGQLPTLSTAMAERMPV